MIPTLRSIVGIGGGAREITIRKDWIQMVTLYRKGGRLRGHRIKTTDRSTLTFLSLIQGTRDAQRGGSVGGITNLKGL